MKILVDLSYVDKDNPTGVSIFALRLLQAVQKLAKDIDLVFIANKNSFGYVKGQFPNSRVYGGIDLPKGSSPLNFIRKFQNMGIIENVINQESVDLFFVPFLSIWTGIPKQVRTIAVIHDVQPFKINFGFKNTVYKYLYKHILNDICQVIAISEFSKGDLNRLFPSSKGKTHVIYNSVVCGEKQKVSSKLFDVPFVLNVNAMVDYKNQLTIIKAFALIKDRIPHNLLFKAKKTNYWVDTLVPIIKEMNLENRVFLIDEKYDESQLNWLYSKADLFVNASTMEGFGFTPIEAAMNETKVLTSKVTALEETTLGKLNYTNDPYDVEELAEKMLRLLSEKREGNKLKSIACTFKEMYSSERQARAYVEIFNKVKNENCN